MLRNKTSRKRYATIAMAALPGAISNLIAMTDNFGVGSG
jgi:hypothetical protein